MRNPFGAAISEATIKNWLGQFLINERWAVKRLLEAFQYYDANTLLKLLTHLHQLLTTKYNHSIGRMWFVPVGYVGRSGAAVAHLYKIANRLAEGCFVSLSDLKTLDLQNSTI